MLELLYFEASLKRLFVLSSLPPALSTPSLLRELKKLLAFLEQQYETKAGSISLVFLSQQKMNQIAQRFLPPPTALQKKVAPRSDVLAFPLLSPFLSEANPALKTALPYCKTRPSGEVLLSLKTIFSAAQAEARLLGYAFCETILHGLWHLFGMQHTYEAACLEKLYQKQARMLTAAGCNWKEIDNAFNQLVFKATPQA